MTQLPSIPVLSEIILYNLTAATRTTFAKQLDACRPTEFLRSSQTKIPRQTPPCKEGSSGHQSNLKMSIISLVTVKDKLP